MQFVRRLERCGPFVITFAVPATLTGDASFLLPYNEAVELDLAQAGVTGCDVRYRLDGLLFACFVFRAHAAPSNEDLAQLMQVVRQLGPRKLPRVLSGTTLVLLPTHTVEVARLTDAELADERERAHLQFSRIDAEFDAQLSALPANTSQIARDETLFASARALIHELATRAQLPAWDYSLESLDTCTQMLGGLQLLDTSRSYYGTTAAHYTQMVLVACAVYAGDVLLTRRPTLRMTLQFNEAGALREIDLIDDSDESDEASLRILRLLTLCLKCQQSFAAHDLKRTVQSFLGA